MAEPPPAPVIHRVKGDALIRRLSPAVNDGMSPAELAAAFRKAGIKGSVPGLMHNMRLKGLIEK